MELWDRRVPFNQHASYAARFRYEVSASGCTVLHRDVFENFRDIYEYSLTNSAIPDYFLTKVRYLISDMIILEIAHPIQYQIEPVKVEYISAI